MTCIKSLFVNLMAKVVNVVKHNFVNDDNCFSDFRLHIEIKEWKQLSLDDKTTLKQMCDCVYLQICETNPRGNLSELNINPFFSIEEVCKMVISQYIIDIPLGQRSFTTSVYDFENPLLFFAIDKQIWKSEKWKRISLERYGYVYDPLEEAQKHEKNVVFKLVECLDSYRRPIIVVECVKKFENDQLSI
jgi:hypothetical protein